MYFIPFIYFSCLTFYFWHEHRTFNLAVYISSLYVITSLCSILMITGGYLNAEGGGVLVDGWEPEFGFIPTVLYCGLITLTIIPFSFIRTDKLTSIINVHPYIIYAFTFFI